MADDREISRIFRLCDDYVAQWAVLDPVAAGARGVSASFGAATDYIFASGWWSDLLPYPQVKAFNAKWKAAMGSEPQWYHACAYETVRVLIAAFALMALVPFTLMTAPVTLAWGACFRRCGRSGRSRGSGRSRLEWPC